MLDDPALAGMKSLTLSYTFFRTGDPEIEDFASDPRAVRHALPASMPAAAAASSFTPGGDGAFAVGGGGGSLTPVESSAAAGSPFIPSGVVGDGASVGGGGTAAAPARGNSGGDLQSQVASWTKEMSERTGTKGKGEGAEGSNVYVAPASAGGAHSGGGTADAR